MRYATKLLVTLSVAVPIAVWGVSRGSVAVVAAPAAQAAPADPYAALPEGAGRKELIATCTKCHAVTNVTNARKDEDGWTQTITKMVGYGATGSDEEFDSILAYLNKNFGPPDASGAAPAPTTPPAPPTTPPPASSGPSAAVDHAKTLVNTCTAAELASGLGFTEDEAAATVKYRTSNGTFKTVADMKKVTGVDGKKLDAHLADLQF